MAKETPDELFRASREQLAREMETLGRLLRDYDRSPSSGSDDAPVVAITRFCRDLSLEEWNKLSENPEFKEWIALPVNSAAYPHLLQLQERMESLSFQSEHDPLTELRNRRGFESTLKLELQRAMRQGQYLSLAILDLDDFKKINDTYGHPCGDEVLVTLADTMIKNKRTYDLASRLGGEEFALILPGAGPSKAEDMVTRLLETFRHIPISCTGVDRAVTATFSAGIASTRTKVRIKPAELMSLADKALYVAKQRGKNNVHAVRAPKELELPRSTMVRSEEKQFLFTGSK